MHLSACFYSTFISQSRTRTHTAIVTIVPPLFVALMSQCWRVSKRIALAKERLHTKFQDVGKFSHLEIIVFNFIEYRQLSTTLEHHKQVMAEKVPVGLIRGAGSL